MKILFITPKISDGVFAVRGALPIKWLKKRGHEIKVVEENGKTSGEEIINLIKWSDVVSISRAYSSDISFIEYMLNYCKKEGKKIIYDTDDLLINLFPEHPAYQAMKEFVPQIRMMTKMADVVTVTGEPLKAEYGLYNSNVAILPNCVDPEEWKLRKGKNKRLRVGWTGTLTHISDLLIISDVIAALQKDHDFDFIIMGMMAEKWDKFKKKMKEDYEKHRSKYPNAEKQQWYARFELLDASLSKCKWEHIPFVPVEKYKDTLRDLNFDIGLCPLEDNRFNSCKSAIKFYEYAMVGTVCLASKVSPYAGEVMYEAKNRYDKWYSKLKALIESPEIREMVLEAQREFVLRERNIETKISAWEEVYEG